MSYNYQKETKISSSGGDERSSRLSSSSHPVIQSRSTVVQRTSHGVPQIGMGMGVGGRSSMIMRQSYGPSFSSEALEKISHEGVNQMKGSREKEKHEMQDLNNRFAGYIEKVRYLEARNKQLQAQLENLKAAQTDFQPIKDRYENELEQARKIVEELTASRGESDAKAVGLQDQLDFEIAEHNKTAKDRDEYRNKLAKLNNQLAEYEAELMGLRRKSDLQDTDNKKLRETNQRLRDELNNTRKDLDLATAQQIMEAGKSQSMEEKMIFDRSVLCDEIDELKKMLDAQQKEDVRGFWTTELQSAIRDMQKEYDQQLDIARNDMEMRMESQMRSMTAPVKANTVESSITQEENRKLKSGVQSHKNTIASLQAKIGLLEQQAMELQRALEEANREHDEREMKSAAEINDLHRALDECTRCLQDVTSAKTSLEMEIRTYEILLEKAGSSLSLGDAMGEAANIQSHGGSSLADIIGSSSFNSSSGGGPVAMQSEETRGMKIHRSARGIVCFDDCCEKFVQIKNTNSRLRGRAQNMRGWRIQAESKGRKISYTFGDVTLEGEETMRVAGKKYPDTCKNEKDIVMEDKAWFEGACNYTLYDETGNEKATINYSFTRLDHWWAEIFKSKAYLSKVVKASLSIFTGPRIEQSFNILNNVIDDKSNRMKIYTYATIQNVKFNLKAQKSSSLELCHREDVYKSPVDKPVVYHVQTTYGRMKRSGS
ncbi:hypothetical protein ScPMuIL_011147 [Solemya velum]